MNISMVGQKCVGCGACCNICPVGAISMKVSADGFLYPHINNKKCINCGMCTSVCPALESGFRVQSSAPQCYAAYSNETNAMHSSSGGIFSVLATHVLENGGYVCGAAFDSQWMVKHIIIQSVSELDKLRVSKYVQSDTNDVYPKIQKLLDDGKTVLFSGTPCQVSGLYGFLHHDYDNLITCDVFCHGAPSPAVWRKYLCEIAGKRKITGINFRDKENAIKNNSACPYNVTFYFDNGDVETMEYTSNSYMNGFLQNLYLRKSCATCRFAKTPRNSDLTLGDFWGYQNIDKKYDMKRGMSAVLLNTPKGENIFKQIIPRLDFVRGVCLNDIVRGNPVLAKPCAHHDNRDDFFSDFKDIKNNFSAVVQRNLINKKVAILNFAPKSDNNYGASLVGYAMEHAITKLGWKPYTVCFIPDNCLYQKTLPGVFWDFAQKFLNLTGICTNKTSLAENLNQKFDRFIIGSDQVVRHPWHDNFVYYLDWVCGNKTLLAYAPSFGIDKLNMNASEHKYAKQCLARFDALSVREHSGAEIFKNDFDMDNVPVVCDPTMLLTADDYLPIINADGKLPVPDGTEYVAYYMLDASTDVLSRLGKRYRLVNAYRDDDGNFRPIGQWLNIIRNAKYVITDSFHGTVFSMIFERQFVTLTTDFRGNDRIDTLMKLVGRNRLVPASQIIDERIHFARQLDYTKINAKINVARRRGYDFLSHALSITPTHKPQIIINKVRHKRHHSFWWHLRHMRF